MDFVNTLESSIIHETLLNNMEPFLIQFWDVSEVTRRCTHPQDVALDLRTVSIHTHMNRASKRTIYSYGCMQYGWFMVRTVLQPVPYPLTNSSPTVRYSIQYGCITVIWWHMRYYIWWSRANVSKNTILSWFTCAPTLVVNGTACEMEVLLNEH